MQIDRRKAVGLIGGVIGGVVAGMSKSAIASTTVKPTSSWTSHDYMDVAGGKIHCATMGTGDGEPLIVFPKLGGWVNDWTETAKLIAPKRRVIAVDFPGHGDSRMNGPAPYITTMAENAAMMCSALDQLGVERFAVAGISMGGVLSAYIAATRPELVSHLVLISTQLISPMPWDYIKDQDKRRAVGQDKEGDPQTTEGLQQKFGTSNMEIIRNRQEANVRAGDWKRSCERGVGRLGIASYLSSIKAPTMWVTANTGTYTRYTDVLLEHVPNATVRRVDGTGSFVQEEKPEVAADLILSHINPA